MTLASTEPHDARSAEHIVQFYDTDDFLAAVLADFVAEGLTIGQAAVVIATPAHRQALVARLESRGLDLAAALAAGRFILLDASETLATFMVGAMPDWDRFKRTIEPVLEAARAAGPDQRPVGLRAYGEMTDVLWRSGNAAGALLLEEMWNDLREADSFTLLCAYVMTNFHDETHGLHRACRSHNRVHPPQQAEGSRQAGTDVLATEIRQRILLECALRDSVNDRQRTQQALDRSERSARDFVDNATVGLQWIGADGTVEWANRAVFELLGYDRSDYLRQPLARFHADPEVVADLLARLAAGERVRGHEARMFAKDGSLKHVLVSASGYREDGVFVQGRFSIHDITARKHAEEALRESERRLQEITDTLPVLVACIDPDQRYQFVNACYARWFGQPRAAFVGHTVREVLGEPRYGLAAPHLAAALSGAMVQFQARMPYADGDRYVEATYLPRRDADGHVIGVVSLITDISERKRHDDTRDANQRRTQRLLGFTAAIADAMTREQVFEVVVDQVAASAGATGAVLWLVEGDAIRIARASSYPAEVTARFPTIALESPHDLPVLECIRRGEPIWINARAEPLEADPHLAGDLITAGFARHACVPVVLQGTPLGAIGCSFAHPSALDDQAERSFLLVVARYTAQALERLRLLGAERASRAHAEAAAARMAALSQASLAFSAAGTDLPTVLASVAGHMVEQHADSSGIYLLPEHGHVLEAVTIRHRDPAKGIELARLMAEHPVRVGEGVTGGVAQTGRAVFLPRIDPDALAAGAAPLFAASGTLRRQHSVLGVPLRARGRVIGVLVAGREGDSPPFTPADFDLIKELAERAALAVENARLSREDQRARQRVELLYRLARSVISAETLDDVFVAALDAIGQALGTTRASILACDPDGIMRFKAWRGLSDEYRAEAERYAPWPRHTLDAQPLVVPDVEADPALAPLLPMLQREQIGGLAFIPLVTGRQLLGTFMVYFESGRELEQIEIDLARAIADHAAAALARFAAVTELRASVRFNEMFTGILGHDLRNPLTGIVTAAQSAMLSNDNDALVRPLTRIVASSERMGRMINQLLDFTRLRLGAGMPLLPRQLDLEQLVREVMDELDDANPDWTLRLEHTGDTVGTWDGDRLGQVFSNLIANAVQHGSAVDGVVIRLDGSRPDQLRAGVHNAGTIPAELVPRLFDALVGGDRVDKAGGLGLGLYITREIVTAHGGTIDVETDGTRGTTFVVTLPRAVAPAARA